MVRVSSGKLSLPVLTFFDRDRRKLTFYFVAEKRIDFRELVRELFRYVIRARDYTSFVHPHRSSLYKTRIWMASLGGTGGFDQ